jgi:hypothetical protein
MKTEIFPVIRTAMCTVIAAATAGCAQQRVAPRVEPVAAQGPTQAVAEPREPKEILMRMATFLSKAPRFSVSLQGSYDVLQESGQMLEFGETRKITVSRPNGLRVEVEHSDGEKHLVVYNGTDITAFSPSQNVYAQASKPGGIDQAVTYFLKDLHMRLPLAALLLSRFPAEIDGRTQSLDYVERTLIHNTPAHHLAGRTETVDYQLWIAEGAQPLPLRAVLTYKNAEGHPQFRADFADWNFAPDVQNARFAFTPPPGARKIAFLAQIPELVIPAATTVAPSGERP